MLEAGKLRTDLERHAVQIVDATESRHRLEDALAKAHAATEAAEGRYQTKCKELSMTKLARPTGIGVLRSSRRSHPLFVAQANDCGQDHSWVVPGLKDHNVKHVIVSSLCFPVSFVHSGLMDCEAGRGFCRWWDRRGKAEAGSGRHDGRARCRERTAAGAAG